MLTPEQFAIRARASLIDTWPELARYPQDQFLRVLGDAAATAIRIAQDPALAAEAERGRNIPPTLDEVKVFLQSIPSDLDPQEFIDFYNVRDWTVDKVGKIRMRDWKSAARRADRLWARPGRANTRGSLTEWERRQKADRLKALQAELHDLRHPGGCAFPVFLTGAKLQRAAIISKQIEALQQELNAAA